MNTAVKLALASLVLTVACKGGGGGSDDTDIATDTDVANDTDVPGDTDVAVDPDGDGLLGADDPTPEGSNVNVLRGTFSGGHADVVEIASYADGDRTVNTDEAYEDDLIGGCDASYEPQGTLCDGGDGTDRSDLSSRPDNTDAGATWNNPPGTVGVLVVDACHDGLCSRVDFSSITAFQMFSDGKTTKLRMYVHAETGDTAPAWNDAGWTLVGTASVAGDGFAVGAGEDQGDPLGSGDPVNVAGPSTDTVVPAVTTRYLRFEAENDGSLDDSSYIELRSVKAFGAPAI